MFGALGPVSTSNVFSLTADDIAGGGTSVSSVPEPGTVGLLGLGLLGIGYSRRRKA